MYPERTAGALGRGGKALGLRKAGDRLGDVVFNKHAGILCLRVAEDQQRHFDARRAYLQCLVQTRDRKIIRARLFQKRCRLHRPVAVGVGLYHAEEAAALGDCRAQGPVIVQQVFRADLSPAAFVGGIHVHHSFL